MNIRAACAKVEATACKNSLAVLSEELLVAQLAKEAAEVAKTVGITQHEVQYESVGMQESGLTSAAQTTGPSLSDVAPTYLKAKEHRHWYMIGQSSSYYEALVTQQRKQSSSGSSSEQPLAPTASTVATPVMVAQIKLHQHLQQQQQQQKQQQAPGNQEPEAPGSARSSNSSTCAALEIVGAKTFQPQQPSPGQSSEGGSSQP